MITAQCTNCAWLYDDDDQEDITCEAFAPGPIPVEILKGQVGHQKPYPGQTNPDVIYTPLAKD